MSEGQIRIGCKWVGCWLDGGHEWDMVACACALEHALSCDKGSYVGCMGNDVVGWCSGGVELKGEWTQMWTLHKFSTYWLSM